MYTNALAVLALAGAAQAHMSLNYPAPLGGAPSINPQSTGPLDKTFNYPLGCCGPDGGDTLPSPGICRGHLDKFDTEDASVTWQPGQDAYFQLTDYSYDPAAPGGTHFGGSCQVGFSVDKGKTWKMAASYHGACPHATNDGSPEAQTFDFKVPTNMPEGEAIFGWVWLNREHESFMSCAKVLIAGGSGDSDGTPAQSSAYSVPSVTRSAAPVQSETEPAQSETEPEETPQPFPQPDEEDNFNQAPAVTPIGAVVTVTTVVATTVYQTVEATETATEESDPSHDWWHNRPHQKVKHNTRRYSVSGTSCDCTRDETTLVARCSCSNSDPNIERQALRLHRRTLYKRVDACDWNSAPSMETSYYTPDANCAPNAKARMPESDTFELGWDVSCGVVAGISDYDIRTFSCDMYG
ncbi:hypothetical protein BDW02DRAFT_146224 [Decorospora gaudefroyi]|uniref:Lytic polysaccharide monooxygenase n=1 Tax=Decorospora gaudefroyi TaxID=184978 RepID=A0A6A5JYQ1_9PLEO|nr:hypothetical protein BDW02DRAFT_146224 [Decorospora gaudefroyi]